MSDGHNLEAHVFVCTNTKEKGASCGARGSVELREAVKKACQDADRGWHGRVRINASGCLGRCADGITAVIYPQADWQTKLTAQDAPKLLEAVGACLDRSSNA
jgi:(2Fe-2S) ferredoxin